jgi:isopenicillin-N N-acyltransferase-like protein
MKFYFLSNKLGVADGSQRDVLEIVALNVRTEIAFGRFSDGCTSLAWHTSKNSFLSQNWDVSVTTGCEGY